MQVSYRLPCVICLLSMPFLHSYYVICQTGFLQLASFIMQSGARSMWCESVRDCMWVLCPSTGVDVSLYGPGVRAKRRTLVEMQAEPQILDQSIEAPKKKERLNCPKVPVGRVAYVLPSNEASVIGQIKCNVQMSFKV